MEPEEPEETEAKKAYEPAAVDVVLDEDRPAVDDKDAWAGI